jgi:hypothetical protein
MSMGVTALLAIQRYGHLGSHVQRTALAALDQASAPPPNPTTDSDSAPDQAANSQPKC